MTVPYEKQKTNSPANTAPEGGVTTPDIPKASSAAALGKSEEEYRLLHESAGFGIGYYSTDGTVISYNTLAARNMNGKPEDFAGKSIFQLFPKEEAELYLGRIKKAAGSSEPQEYVDRVNLPAGVRWFHSVFTRISDATGTILGIQIISVDITERKRMEEALLQNEERYRSLFELASDPLFLFDSGTGQILDANRAAVSLYGYSLDEIRGMKNTDFSAEPEKTLKAMRDNVLSIPLRYHRKKDGTAFPVEISVNTINLHGRSVRFAAIRDITERKKNEQALRESEEKYRVLVDNASEAVLVAQDGMLRFVNRKATELSGYPESELLEKPFPQFIHPDDRQMVVDNYQKRLRGETAPSTYEFRFPNKDGGFRWLQINSVLITWKGKPATLNLLSDITVRKQVETALRKSEAKFRAIVENSNDGILFGDAKGIISYRSPSYSKLNGFTDEERVGRSGFETVHPEDVNALREWWGRMVGNPGQTFKTEYRVRHKNGSWIWLETTAQNLLNNPDVREIVVASRDITERKQAEEALRKSREQLVKAQRIAAMGSWEFDPFTHSIQWSDEMFRIFGLDPGKGPVTFEKNRELVFPDDREKFDAFAQQAAIADKPFEVELRVVRPDGSHRHHLTRCEVERGADGKVLRLFGTTQDITERKTTLEIIRKSEAKFKAVVENSYDGIVFCDADAKVLYRSPSYIRISGHSNDEREGRSGFETVHSDDLDKVKHSWRQLIQRPLVPMRVEFRTRHKDGSWRWIEAAAQNMLADPDVRAVIIVSRDITERKQAEQTLYDTMAFNQKILDASPVGILAYQESGPCVMANQSAAKIIGGTVEGLLAQNFQLIESWKKTGLYQAAQKALDSKSVVNLETHVLTTFGKDLYLSLQFTPCTIKGKPHLLVFSADITERTLMQATLQNAQKLESLGLLAGGIAHDFNNLLGGIYGFIDLAAETADGPKQRSYLSKAMATIDRGRDLTRQLITFAKGGAPVLAKAELFPFVKEMALFALSGSNISCTFDVPDGLWACSYDRNQVGQVIDNIVINAKQAMPSGGTIEIAARNITFSENDHPLLKAGRYVKISIKDQGIGMPREILPRIFDPFFTTKAAGHGLGLATSYSIVKRHQGTIEVESEPGKGSAFHVFLPAAAGRIADVKTPGSRKFKGSGLFLVMDDQDSIREVSKSFLESLGFKAVCVENGKEAVDFIAEEIRSGGTIAGALLDLTIPGGMGGKEAAEILRKMGISIPLFAASGHAEDPVIARPRDFGFTGSISKPFRKPELAALLKKHMKKS